MFNYFKTNYYINHPLDYLTTKIKLIEHDTTFNNVNKICKLGNFIGYIAPLWFIGRHYISDITLRNNINKKLIILLFIGTLLTNSNSFVYSLPIFVIEYVQNL